MTETVEARTRLKFRRLNAPNYVSIDTGKADERDTGYPALPVAGLDAEALAAIASAWLDDFYAKTEHTCPFLKP